MSDIKELEKTLDFLKKEKLRLNAKLEDEHKKLLLYHEELLQHNKYSKLGEMMSQIIHQWKQPLMEISSLCMPLESKLVLNEPINNQELDKTLKNIQKITQYMSQTIEDFRSFYQCDKQKNRFKIGEPINLSLQIIAQSLKENNIYLDVIIKHNPALMGLKNELAQVLVNIINNAKEALLLCNIPNPKISLKVKEKDEVIIIEISDNAGGIKTQPIHKIFEPFYSYEKPTGTGLGLFMCKVMIEEHHNGYIRVNNDNKGAIFTLYIPKN